MVVIEILCPCVSWCTPMASSHVNVLTPPVTVICPYELWYPHPFIAFIHILDDIEVHVTMWKGMFYTVWDPQISLFCIFYLQDIVKSFIYEWMWHLLKPHFSNCKYIWCTCIVMCGSVIRSTFLFVIRYTKKQCYSVSVYILYSIYINVI